MHQTEIVSAVTWVLLIKGSHRAARDITSVLGDTFAVVPIVGVARIDLIAPVVFSHSASASGVFKLSLSRQAILRRRIKKVHYTSELFGLDVGNVNGGIVVAFFHVGLELTIFLPRFFTKYSFILLLGHSVLTHLETLKISFRDGFLVGFTTFTADRSATRWDLAKLHLHVAIQRDFNRVLAVARRCKSGRGGQCYHCHSKDRASPVLQIIGLHFHYLDFLTFFAPLSPSILTREMTRLFKFSGRSIVWF